MFRAGAAYFALVFSAGFVLGVIRTVWIVPFVGVRFDELMESPIMLAVTILAARRMVRRGASHPLAAGLIALSFLVCAEIAMTVIRGLSLRGYMASRDQVSGTVYLVLLAAFGLMPWLLTAWQSQKVPSSEPALLDEFLPKADIRLRHQVLIGAPVSAALTATWSLDMESIAIIRMLFWLRSKALGAKDAAGHRPLRISDLLDLGWARLAEGEHSLAMGTVCQPWRADAMFRPIPPAEFASFDEPDCVKIALTFEAESLGPMRTCFATETRVLATDENARRKFRAYWRKFGIGIVLIRRLLLARVRREPEAAQLTK